MIIKKSVKLILTVFLVSLVLYGCGDKRKSANLVTVGITQDLDSLDPHKAVAAGTKEVILNIFEGLYKLDKDGKLVPAVAQSYDVSEDGLVYTFHIREGIKFHNGELVTAKDIEYSIKRSAGLLETVDPKIVVEKALFLISQINILNDESVEIVLESADSEFPYYLTTALIVPADYEAIETHPVGTGPYKFVSYSPLENITLAKYGDYYIEGLPSVESIVFKISANTDSAFLELRAGAIDILPYLTDAQSKQIPDNYYVAEGSMNLIQGIFLNNKEAPFDDIRVRKAISYGLDRQGVIDIVGGGKGDILGTNMFPGFKEHYDADLVNIYPYNKERAKELLKEAGYEDGLSFTIKVPSNYQYHIDTSQIVIEQLREIGVDAKIQLIEWSTWLSEVYTDRNYQATLSGLAADVAPRKALERFRSSAGNNFMNYEKPEFDEIYKRAETETNEEAKIQLYKDMQRLLTEDAVAVYIQDPYELVAVNKKIKGYTFYPIFMQDMAIIHIDED